MIGAKEAKRTARRWRPEGAKARPEGSERPARARAVVAAFLGLALAAACLAAPSARASEGGEGGGSAAYTRASVPQYFAEGCTREGFETWLTAVNGANNMGYDGRNSYPITDDPWWKLHVDYVTNEGVVASKAYDFPMQSRLSIYVNAEIGPGYDVGFVLWVETNSDNAFLVERPMYFSYVGRGGHEPWQGGHVAPQTSGVYRGNSGAEYVPRLPLRQLFAEGTTREGFDEWICVLNPNDEPAQLTLNYMIEGEGLFPKQEVVPARHRATFYVADHVGRGKDVSLELVSDQPVLAERPMYFSYRSVNPERPGRPWRGGHTAVAVREEALRFRGFHDFAFCPGLRVPGMGWADTWVCLQNPNPFDLPIKFVVYAPDGYAQTVKTVPARQRATFYYPDLLCELGLPAGGVGYPLHLVQNDPPRKEGGQSIYHDYLVERPLYMEFDSVRSSAEQPPADGTVAYRPPAYGSYFAEGHTGDGFEEWVASSTFVMSEYWRGYYNDPANQDEVWFTYFSAFPQGRPLEKKEVTIAQARAAGVSYPAGIYLWRVGADYPNTDISVGTQSPYAERVMIFSYKGKWVGMHSGVPQEAERTPY